VIDVYPAPVDQQTSIALLTGGFALAGGLGGVLLSGTLTRKAENRRLRAEDERRWLTDRRAAYGAFLGLAEAMLRQIDGVAVFLSYGVKEPVPETDEELIAEGLHHYFTRWEDELQPALGGIELLASPEVADLADRVSGALMDLTANVELRGTFKEHYPTWFQAQDLLEVLRNAMRVELGLPIMSLEKRNLGRRTGDWPWLPDRPPRESYIQNHESARRKAPE
jgi:hypothetical protein